MRAYFFGNMYLSSIQQGIQAAHCISEMFCDYQTDTLQRTQLLTWGSVHKTMILLNAGYSSSVVDIAKFLSSRDNPYPHGVFRESSDALNHAFTCASVIIPKKIYVTAQLIRRDIHSNTITPIIKQLYNTGELEVEDPDSHLMSTWEFTKWEIELCEKLNNYHLAK